MLSFCCTTTLPPPLSTPTPTPTPNSKPPSKASLVETLRTQVRSNSFHEAISTYINLTSLGIHPDNFVFPAILKASSALHDLKFGQQIHCNIVKLGYDRNSTPVANTLVHMYGKCGCEIDHVYKVFDGITQRDQVSWNSLINALCKLEEWELALDAFRSMGEEGILPSSFTLVSVALACSNVLDGVAGLRLGKEVHGYALRTDHDRKTFTSNALMTMYAKLGRIDDSRAIFKLFGEKDLVSWNTIISSFSQSGRFYEAMELFRCMVLEKCKPDGVTISTALPACSHLELLDVGREIHAYAFRNDDLVRNAFVTGALVDMYCNCKKADVGRKVFDGAVDRRIGIWNAMFAGYSQNGYYDKALELFKTLLEVSGLLPNPTTMTSVLPACIHSKSFSDKKTIHGYALKLGFGKDRYVQNALVDLYARMGRIEISKYIFDTIENKDIVSWNTMITGYVVCGWHEDALYMLHEMQRSNTNNEEDYGTFKGTFKPNSITLMTILPGCAALTALSKGKEIHAYAIRNALSSDVAVGSALVDMYAKCGCLDLARNVFDCLPIRNVITWNVMIMAYGMHGKGEEALELLRMMVEEPNDANIKPNDVTFIAIFAACSHSGMVDEGRQLFYKMNVEYGVEPKPDHFSCVVDLLGRAGRLEEAHELVKAMPEQYDKSGAWSSLLGACRIHQNVELGEISANNLLQLEPHIASHHVLLSNIYSSAGLWDKANEVRRNMKEKGVKKEPGCSWIEYGDEVHKFVAGDASHPQNQKLYSFLENLSEKMKKEGYVPDTASVLHNIDEEQKENMLCGHSEKLAIAFGILNTPPGTTIRVAKNLRVCNDCHAATKVMTKVLGREIIMRDVRRFHHFKNGTCSCGDYW
ncbi:hypothetical protein Leryth_017072 [Lithospermum erythrorhizon]|nr:hypothetical protein Leryth_017072 [Lithospermum erythrorhizon]